MRNQVTNLITEIRKIDEKPEKNVDDRLKRIDEDLQRGAPEPRVDVLQELRSWKADLGELKQRYAIGFHPYGELHC
jgi:hypothetical protein